MKKAFSIALNTRKNILPKHLYYKKRHFYTLIAHFIQYSHFNWYFNCLLYKVVLNKVKDFYY